MNEIIEEVSKRTGVDYKVVSSCVRIYLKATRRLMNGKNWLRIAGVLTIVLKGKWYREHKKNNPKRLDK